MMYAGACYITRQVASWIRDSLKLQLPTRDTAEHWHDMFYDAEGYFFNYPPTDTTNVNLGTDLAFGKITVKNTFYIKNNKYKSLFIKLEKDDLPHDAQKLKAKIQVRYKGKESITELELRRLNQFGPQKYAIFKLSLTNGQEPLKLVELGFEAK